MSGKGGSRRKGSDDQKYCEGWDQIFGPKNNLEGVRNMTKRLVEIGSSNYTTVYSLDAPGAGGAYHEYVVEVNETKEICARINFQKGAIKEEGVNGCYIEDLLAICLDRLREFQSGPFPCHENEMAITNIDGALFWLKERTNMRKKRNVEGQSVI